MWRCLPTSDNRNPVSHSHTHVKNLPDVIFIKRHILIGKTVYLSSTKYIWQSTCSISYAPRVPALHFHLPEGLSFQTWFGILALLTVHPRSLSENGANRNNCISSAGKLYIQEQDHISSGLAFAEMSVRSFLEFFSMSWVLLIIAGLFEVVWSVSMKLSSGFSQPLWSVVTVVELIVSFAGLMLATKHLPISIA